MGKKKFITAILIIKAKFVKKYNIIKKLVFLVDSLKKIRYQKLDLYIIHFFTNNQTII